PMHERPEPRHLCAPEPLCRRRARGAAARGSGGRGDRQRGRHAALRGRRPGRSASQTVDGSDGRRRSRRGGLPAPRLSAGAPGARVERRRTLDGARGGGGNDAGGPAGSGGRTEGDAVGATTVERRVLGVDDEEGVGESGGKREKEEYDTM